VLRLSKQNGREYVVAFILIAFVVFLFSISLCGQTVRIANAYLVGVDTDQTNVIEVARNFAAILNGPISGTTALTLRGGYVSAASSMLSLINSNGNTFSGSIILDVDCGTFRLAGNLYTNIPGMYGCILPAMDSADTVTVRRGSFF